MIPPPSLGLDLELLALEPAPLGVALEHPRDVGGPERGLVAAHALAHLDDHVLVVGGVALDERELELLLEPRDVGLVVGDHLGELGVVAGRVEVGARLAPLLRQLVRRLELLDAPADLGRLAVVVVDGGIGEPLLRLEVGALELLDGLLEARTWRSG